MISVSVEMDALKEIEQKLDAIGMSGKSASIIKKAVNETARQAKKKLAVKAKATYTVKKGNFSEVMHIRGATTGNLTATIEAKSEPLPLTRFKNSVGKKTTKAQVLRDGSSKKLEVGGVKAFKTMFGQHVAIAQRVPEEEYTADGAQNRREKYAPWKMDMTKIEEKKGPSIAAMIGSKHTFGEEKENILADLKDSLAKHIEVLKEG